MSKTKKFFIILIITFLLVNIFNEVFATIDPGDYEPGSVTTEDTKYFFAKTEMVLGAIRNISIMVSVIVLMIIGFKYIVGSAEEKANYKQTMIPYIIGCIMAVAGTTLVDYIYNMFH